MDENSRRLRNIELSLEEITRRLLQYDDEGKKPSLLGRLDMLERQQAEMADLLDNHSVMLGAWAGEQRVAKTRDIAMSILHVVELVALAGMVGMGYWILVMVVR